MRADVVMSRGYWSEDKMGGQILIGQFNLLVFKFDQVPTMGYYEYIQINHPSKRWPPP